MKTVVLLGAGASADARIPMAVQMVPSMLSGAHVAPDSREDFRAVLGYAHSALALHLAGTGIPSSSMDIEHLANVVAAIASRTESDLAPLVGSWISSLDSFERTYAHRAAEFTRSGSPFGWAFEQMLWSLREICTIGRHEGARADYLAPLLDLLLSQRAITIASLNYDNAVELLCERSGVNVVAPGPIERSAEPANRPYVELLHLHGSVDWNLVSIAGASTGGRISVVSDHPHPPDLHDSNYRAHIPALLFAGHNKLRADGPWLTLLSRFEQALGTADRLVVVGYGFRDAHINAILHRRSRQPGAPSLETVICDPTPNREIGLNDDIFHHSSKMGYVLEGAANGLRRSLNDPLADMFDNPMGWPNDHIPWRDGPLPSEADGSSTSET